MFGSDEGVSVCPDCGVDLQPLSTLGPSAETILEREAEIENTPRQWQVRPLWDLGHGKGVLLLLAAVGLLSFFQPWVRLTRPEATLLSGYVIARHYAGWIWGGAVGWFILVPLVLTRRTLVQMRGVRIVSTLLASLTFFEVLMMATLSATRGGRVLVVFEWEPWFWVSGGVSLLGAIGAVMLGMEFGKAGPQPSTTKPATMRRTGTSTRPSPGQWLH
jgi:hypothetical protein